MTTKTTHPPKKPVHHEPPRHTPPKPPEPPAQIRSAPPPIPSQLPAQPITKPPESPHWNPKDMEQTIIDIYRHVGDRYSTSAGIKRIMEIHLGAGYAKSIPPE